MNHLFPKQNASFARRVCRAAGICALLAVAGCGGSAEKDLVENRTFSGPKVTIRFSFWGGTTEMEDFRAIAEAFVRRHPNVRVKLAVLPWGQYWAKLQTQAAGNIAPDVIRLYSGKAAYWFESGALVDLRPYIERDGVDLSAYFPVAIKASIWEKPTERKGPSPPGIYSLPSDIPIRVLIYNKDLFDQAGLSGQYPPPDKPMTWEELVSLAAKLTIWKDGRPVQYGFSLGPQLDLILIHQAGGRLVDKQVAPTRSTAYSPEVIRGIQFYYDLQFTYRVAPDIATQAEQGFGGGEAPLLSGRVAMGIAGPWTFATYRASGMRFGIAPLFRGAHRAQICTPNSNAVYRHSPHREEAWQFVKFMASEEGQRIIAKRGVGVPSLRSVARSDDFYNNIYQVKDLHVYCDDLEHAEPMMISPVDLERPFQEALGMVRRRDRLSQSDLAALGLDKRYKGGTIVTPEVAAAMIHAGIDRALERLRPRALSVHARVTAPLVIAILTAAALVGLVFAGRRWRETKPIGAGRKSNLAGYLFILPWLIGLVLFNIGPIAATLLLGFTRWDLIGAPKWVGVRNYVEIFTRDIHFWKSVKVTLIYVSCSVPISVVGGLISAVLLNQGARFSGLFRSIIYLPSLLSGVAMTLLWKWMYNPEVGIINYILGLIGLPGPDWLGSQRWVLWAVIFMNFLSVGGSMLIFYAALQGIPESLYEAAEIDGAGAIGKFFHITLPMLSPAILFNVVISSIASFQAFVEPFMIAQSAEQAGGPNDASLLYVLYAFLKAFHEYEMGYACALILILFGVIFSFTYLQFRLSRQWVYYESEV